MSKHFDPTREKFVVVCGMPRCGTRQFTDFMSRHDSVALQGEISNRVVPIIRKAVEAADQLYPAGYAADAIAVKRPQTIIQMFGSFSKTMPINVPAAPIQGFKSPSAELMYRDLNALLLPSFPQVRYFYCIRNPIDCYLSLSSMPWFAMGANDYIDRYITSISAASQIARIGAEGRKRVVISTLNLDSFIASKDKAMWLRQRIFAPLKIGPSVEWLAKISRTTENRNATERVTGTRRDKSMQPEALAIFKAREADLQKAIEVFNATFKETLSLKLPQVVEA